MDIRTTCPLGHQCEVSKDGYVERCAWFTELSGTTADGDAIDDWKCAIAWQPILQVETSMTNKGQTEAIESMRNENTKRQDAALQIAFNRGVFLDK